MLTKPELLTHLSERTGLPKRRIEDVLDALSDAVIVAMREGRPIRLPGIGTFEARERPARVYQSGLNGVRYMAPPRPIPKFRPAKPLQRSTR